MTEPSFDRYAFPHVKTLMVGAVAIYLAAYLVPLLRERPTVWCPAQSVKTECARIPQRAARP